MGVTVSLMSSMLCVGGAEPGEEGGAEETLAGGAGPTEGGGDSAQEAGEAAAERGAVETQHTTTQHISCVELLPGTSETF